MIHIRYIDIHYYYYDNSMAPQYDYLHKDISKYKNFNPFYTIHYIKGCYISPDNIMYDIEINYTKRLILFEVINDEIDTTILQQLTLYMKDNIKYPLQFNVYKHHRIYTSMINLYKHPHNDKTNKFYIHDYNIIAQLKTYKKYDKIVAKEDLKNIIHYIKCHICILKEFYIL